QCASDLPGRRRGAPRAVLGTESSAQMTASTPAHPLADVQGPYFGRFGGRYVPEALIAALDELEAEYAKAKDDPEFTGRLAELHRTYSGRPSILTEAARFAEHAGGARVLLKREDLNH